MRDVNIFTKEVGAASPNHATSQIAFSGIPVSANSALGVKTRREIVHSDI
jgi:hypothetical protein